MKECFLTEKEDNTTCLLDAQSWLHGQGNMVQGFHMSKVSLPHCQSPTPSTLSSSSHIDLKMPARCKFPKDSYFLHPPKHRTQGWELTLQFPKGSNVVLNYTLSQFPSADENEGSQANGTSKLLQGHRLCLWRRRVAAGRLANSHSSGF